MLFSFFMPQFRHKEMMLCLTMREQIFAKSELQKIDLMTLSLVIKAIEEVLEENKDEHAVSATNDELYT